MSAKTTWDFRAKYLGISPFHTRTLKRRSFSNLCTPIGPQRFAAQA